jgi:hypothetical protein
MKNINKKIISVLIFVAVFTLGAQSTEAQYSTSYNSQSNTRATLSGTVNPGGNTTTAWFEYSNNSNFSNHMETNHQFIGSQNGEYPLTATITGLVPNATYYARIVADNGKSIIRGNVINFTTNGTITNTIVNNPVVTHTNTYTNTVARNQVMYVEAPYQRQEVVYVQAPIQRQAVTYIEVPQNQVYAYNQVYSQNTLPVNYAYLKNNTTNLNTNTLSTNLLSTNTNTVIDYNEDYNNYNNTVTANAFFIGDFLPNNLFGWLILILVVVGIIAVIRRLVI